MTRPAHATLDDWITRESISFSLDSPESFNSAVDRILTSLGDSVDLLGFGEALHGGEEILLLRNRLFQRLVEAHGYSAIAVESSFPRGRIANDYVLGQGSTSPDAVWETGFSHGFGRLEANRELVEWMRHYNANNSAQLKIHFCGFDSPTEMTGADSPRRLLQFALDYLASIDGPPVDDRRRRIDDLLGPDADWENPAASFDPTKSVGLSPAATTLRIETEDLLTELGLRRPELGSKSDRGRYLDAMQHALVARHMLNYHAELARASTHRIARLLGIRDLIMADNLAYMVERERGRGGKVFAFAHNSHLKRGQARWQWGPNLLEWWPAGAQVNELLGTRYAVIGSGVGISDDNGIAPPESGTLEGLLAGTPGPIRFVPTHRGEGLPPSTFVSLPTRSTSKVNPTYFPLTPQSLNDFDGLLVLDSITYNRGGPHLTTGG